MKKSDMPRCSTCSQYDRPSSNWEIKHDAGGCGEPKIMVLDRKYDISGKLDDRMVSWPPLSVKIGSNFGCIHHSDIDT